MTKSFYQFEEGEEKVQATLERFLYSWKVKGWLFFSWGKIAESFFLCFIKTEK